MEIRIPFPAAAALLAASLALLPAPSHAAIVNISIHSFQFGSANATVTVNVGDTVKWTNNDLDDHTVTSGNGAEDGKFDSGNLAANGVGVFSLKFNREGTFPYFCQYHGTMLSAIKVVRPSKTWQVDIDSFAFQPNALTIVAGDKVTWTNHDGFNHSATSGTSPTPDGKFNTGLFGQNASRSAVVSAVGTIPYFCTAHTGMKASITVTAAPILGDANGDGKVDAADVLVEMRTAGGLAPLTTDQAPYMDVFPLGFGDGSVDFRDATHLLRYVLKMDSNL